MSDPKRPDAVVPYHLPVKQLDEIDPDLFGTFSLMLSTVGLIAKIKWATWGALIFSIISITNEKASDQDPSSGRTSALTSLLFASSGLVINYMYLFMGGPEGPSKKS